MSSKFPRCFKLYSKLKTKVFQILLDTFFKQEKMMFIHSHIFNHPGLDCFDLHK